MAVGKCLLIGTRLSPDRTAEGKSANSESERYVCVVSAVANATSYGYNVINSQGWYLDQLAYDWAGE